MSVLRYPGGKTRAVRALLDVLPDNVTKLYSPFFGGGSFELTCAQKKQLKVHGNDLFEHLINFWQTAQTRKKELVAVLREVQPSMNKQTLTEYRKHIESEPDPVRRAVYYFAINRCSFSGATFSGGFSEEAIKKRFTVSSIDRLDYLDLSSCEFSNVDFEEFLNAVPRETGVVIYADPPYHLESKSILYGNKGDLHMTFEHDRFYDCMTEITDVPWIISYNDCNYVRNKYEKYRIEPIAWAYGMSSNKTSNEVLIFGGSIDENC